MESGICAGVIIRGREISEERSIPLGNFPSVFQAEVTAITELSVRLDELQITDHDIIIYSDSRSSLEALATKTIHSLSVRTSRDRLSSLARSNCVTVKWIPGHAGHAGNELADQKAREGSGSPFIGPEPAIPISLQLVGKGGI